MLDNIISVATKLPDDDRLKVLDLMMNQVVLGFVFSNFEILLFTVSEYNPDVLFLRCSLPFLSLQFHRIFTCKLNFLKDPLNFFWIWI